MNKNNFKVRVELRHIGERIHVRNKLNFHCREVQTVREVSFSKVQKCRRLRLKKNEGSDFGSEICFVSST
jgi:hypothetical protein